jgi:hypothetical protein
VAKQSGHEVDHSYPSIVEVKNLLTCLLLSLYAIMARTMSYLVIVTNMHTLINFTKVNVHLVVFTFGTMISLVTKITNVRLVAILTQKCQKCFALLPFSNLLNIFLYLHFKPFPLRMMQPAHASCLMNCSFQPCDGVGCYSVGK